MSNTRYNFGSFGIVLQDDKEIIQSLHRTQMTETEKYDNLVSRIAAIRQEAQNFINQQEREGKLKSYIVGGNSEGEIYPNIAL
jgi:hypothetical protein